MEDVYPELDTEVTDQSLEQQQQPIPTPPRSPPTSPIPSSGSEEVQKPLNLNTGFMPSASNDFQFEYDSPTGLCAKELNALFKLPARPKNDPRDLASLKVSGVSKSFTWLGTKPKLGLAGKLVQEMELQEAKSAKALEEKENDDECSEIGRGK